MQIFVKVKNMMLIITNHRLTPSVPNNISFLSRVAV